MSTDTKNKYRVQLGPKGRQILDSLTEQNAAGLDAELLRLQETAALVPGLEEDRQRIIKANHDLGGHVGSLAKAVASLSSSVTDQMHMIDHRTREFEKLLLHISGMVGSHMTDGAERDRLHVRLKEIAVDMTKQIEKLSTLINDQHKARQAIVQNAVARAEEERLTVFEKRPEGLTKQAPERAGMER